ncbi:hypothetical protein DMC14_002085 [Metamycoplasma phocicerebrale]|uniref:Uncharacterized protein n=1 Tax=Metamycoplasma phocicerebrale TaxID=142649 RepID=A0A3Q9V371_9BACT|nr:hypothetical protein DMC14_002085 [Metamycoplasma phocicerebrale]
MSLFFIFVYISWTKKYNSQIESLPFSPKLIKEKIYWEYIYSISFSLIYLSFLSLQVTKFSILIKNKNGFLKSLFSLFFINKLILINENSKVNKLNFISLFVVLNLALISIFISAIFNIISDRIHWSFIVFFIYFITIMIIYIPIAICFNKKTLIENKIKKQTYNVE